MLWRVCFTPIAFFLHASTRIKEKTENKTGLSQIENIGPTKKKIK